MTRYFLVSYTFNTKDKSVSGWGNTIYSVKDDGYVNRNRITRDVKESDPNIDGIIIVCITEMGESDLKTTLVFIPATNKEESMDNLTHHFKIHPGSWEHPINPGDLLDAISFVFTMKGYRGLYFKLKEPCFGMDCFEFQFDTDNGIWIKDGDMRFNDYMGQQITDSGADVVNFIKRHLINSGLESLIIS